MDAPIYGELDLLKAKSVGQGKWNDLRVKGILKI